MKQIRKKILFPIDFQKQSLIALEYTIYFANAIDAEIVLLHIIEEGNFITKMFSPDDFQEKAIGKAKKLLGDIADKIKDEHPISTIVEVGKVYDKIVEIAERIEPIFIIIGKSEEPTFARTILGSNTLHVVKEVQFPVVTIRGTEYMIDYQRHNRSIVLPLDVTKEIREQTATAIEFGKLLNSEINVVSVLTSDSLGTELSMIKRLSKVKKIIEKEGLGCTTKLIKETKMPVHKVVIDYAKDEDAHLIVLMTQSELSMVDYFIGSTAQGLINYSEIPVLSIIPGGNWTDSVFSVIVDPLGVLSKVE